MMTNHFPKNPAQMRCVDRPASYPRRVVLAVIGTSPQVLTETLYALASDAREPFVPTEVHVITTEEGVRQIEARLLDPEAGAFHAFCKDYGLDGKIDFRLENITRLRGGDGRPLEDVRTPEDNARTADQIMDWVRDFTSDPESALHVSLAGGRKTMGFFLGYALSLFGRGQDRLSHVLVSAPFDRIDEFHYPPRKVRILETREGGTVRTSDARIHLAEIPFVRLRDGLPDDIRHGRGSFSEVVSAAQRAVGPLEIRIDPRARTLSCGGTPIRLAPQHLAFYAWHAWRRKTLGDAAPAHWSQREPIETEFLQMYLQVLDDDDRSPFYLTARRKLANGFDKDNWAERVSRVEKALRMALGETAAHPYLFTRTRVGSSSHISIGLAPELIILNESMNSP